MVEPRGSLGMQCTSELALKMLSRSYLLIWLLLLLRVQPAIRHTFILSEYSESDERVTYSAAATRSLLPVPLWVSWQDKRTRIRPEHTFTLIHTVPLEHSDLASRAREGRQRVSRR